MRAASDPKPFEWPQEIYQLNQLVGRIESSKVYMFMQLFIVKWRVIYMFID